jgi:hypothetical protein
MTIRQDCGTSPHQIVAASHSAPSPGLVPRLAGAPWGHAGRLAFVTQTPGVGNQDVVRIRIIFWQEGGLSAALDTVRGLALRLSFGLLASLRLLGIRSWPPPQSGAPVVRDISDRDRDRISVSDRLHGYLPAAYRAYHH